MSRKMASIQRIWKVEKHPNADALDIVNVMGWKCVAKIGEFQPQDLCIYLEIDSVVPKDDERFKFLETSHWRVRSKKIRGMLSQGLCLPLSYFGWTESDIELGLDVSANIGVSLFESYENFNAQEASGSFPGWIRKIDQERIQNLNDQTMEEYSKLEFEITEKIEGSSGTFFVRDGEFYACSRNLVMRLIDGSRWKHLNDKYNLESKLKAYGKNIALQGECIGPKISGNIYKLTSFGFRIFDVFNIDEQRYLSPRERYDVLHDLGLIELHVPIIETSFSFNGMNKDQMLEMADGQSDLGQCMREGLVWKSTTLVDGDTRSFKTVSNRYLLKHDA